MIDRSRSEKERRRSTIVRERVGWVPREMILEMDRDRRMQMR